MEEARALNSMRNPYSPQISIQYNSETQRLVFEDNGIGIPADELPRIFEKGFTGTNGRNRERSTGMGLYLCRKLCDKLNIEIRAESAEGKGTEIILMFPVSDYLTGYRET